VYAEVRATAWGPEHDTNATAGKEKNIATDKNQVNTDENAQPHLSVFI
jgi:hypothetical protein